MEQIYYTQCPMGYGLGASNGFQIKRLSRGYPVSGDFRHLGLRAFLAASRSLAPPALRYRWDGGAAEVAWLTPREREYETERGLWGRPGGHFAHGVRLSAEEFAAIAQWPAGLYDRPFWRRSDPEPTRDRLPEELRLGYENLMVPPEFATVASLAEGEDSDRLARLLTAMALVVREGRTLFLIDEPRRLAERVALLTFAFPEVMRAELTFSTYHDRPEDLPGYRISGTVPAARPNRVALAALGIVADLTTGQIEPRVEAARWASTLAGWLVGRSREDEAAWIKTDARARRARPPAPPETIWSDRWLDRLIAFQASSRPPATVPETPAAWADLAEATEWAGRAGLADEWLIRGSSWWREAIAAATIPEARSALVAHAARREAWPGAPASAAAWGEVAAAWFAAAEPAERFQAAVALLRAAPAPLRMPFLAALLKALPTETADDLLARLRASAAFDPAVLLPLEVRGAVGAALGLGEKGPLVDVLTRALQTPSALKAVLDALADEGGASPEVIPSLASGLADALDATAGAGRAETLAWALRRGDDAEDWLGPYFRRLFADPTAVEAWRNLRDETDDELRPMLACTVLAITQDPTLPDAAFRWGVEELLLGLEPSRRPQDPTWADHYLHRTPSGLDLVKRLFVRDRRHPELKGWLAAARQRGEISPEQSDRLDHARSYARALASGDANALLSVDLPEVPPSERGALLGQMLGHVGKASFDDLRLCLETCRHTWPDGFAPGAPGLDGLARPLAEALAPYRRDPGLWLARLRQMLDILGAS
ncbi:MAG: hypothetical protein IRY99_20915, partial [Isosphaeraceae bacterium]|nr:hypothetical protein [Isosphaeraceae bacterium]